MDVNEIQYREFALGCQAIVTMVPASAIQVSLPICKQKINCNYVNKMALCTENWHITNRSYEGLQILFQTFFNMVYI